jgi:hypothetical protein
MKRLYMIIAVAMLSIAASAQPTPTTFLDVQIAGGKETVAAQLIDAGFKESSRLSSFQGEFMGEPVTAIISYSKTVKQVTGLFVNTDSRFDAAGVIKKFNQIVSDFEKDQKYTADPANKKIPAGAPLTNEYLYDNNSFEVKFYEGGDKKKEVAISVGMMDGQFYVYFRYNNKYNTSN